MVGKKNIVNWRKYAEICYICNEFYMLLRV